MKRKTSLLMALIICVALPVVEGCKGKAEKENTKEEAALTPPDLGPHSMINVKGWIAAAGKDADAATIEKLREHTGKYSAGEIISGMAVRKVPDYWNNVSRDEKIRTVDILNTSFSKLRIKAGFAEEAQTFNSTLYMEDEEGTFVAVSDKDKGTFLIK